VLSESHIIFFAQIQDGRIQTLIESCDLKGLKDVEEAALFIREHIPGVIAADLVHGPAAICGATGLGWENDSAEAGLWESIVLRSTHTTGITSAAVILTEVPVFGSQI